MRQVRAHRVELTWCHAVSSVMPRTLPFTLVTFAGRLWLVWFQTSATRAKGPEAHWREAVSNITGLSATDPRFSRSTDDCTHVVWQAHDGVYGTVQVEVLAAASCACTDRTNGLVLRARVAVEDRPSCSGSKIRDGAVATCLQDSNIEVTSDDLQ